MPPSPLTASLSTKSVYRLLSIKYIRPDNSNVIIKIKPRKAIALKIFSEFMIV